MKKFCFNATFSITVPIQGEDQAGDIEGVIRTAMDAAITAVAAQVDAEEHYLGSIEIEDMSHDEEDA